MAEAFKACRAASQSISAASSGGQGSQEATDACSPRRQAIRHRHSAVDEGRGGRVVARHIYQMNQQIANLRDFRAALAAGERLYSVYKFNQTGSTPISVPELCNYYDIGKTKIYELLRGEKYKYPVKEEAEKKPV